MAIRRTIKVGNTTITTLKKVIKVGNVTQLLDKNNFLPTITNNTLTFTNNGNGSIIVTGTVSDTIRSIYSISNLKNLIKGHKYLLCGCPKIENDNHFLTLNVYDNMGKLLNMWYDFGDGNIFTFDQEYYYRNIGGIYIYERQVEKVVDRSYTPQLFDLTDMYGPGNEPTTVAKFKEDHPDEYYPYQKSFLTVYNKAIKPNVKDGDVIQLVNSEDFGFTTQTVNGITFTNNNDGSITINGTATSEAYMLILKRDKVINGYVYLYGSEQNTNDYGVAWGTNLPNNSTFAINSMNNNYTIIVKNGVTVNNIKIFPQIYNLTAMYSKGNEPTTLALFREKYPNTFYSYNVNHTKNLWTCNKQSNAFTYDKHTQIYTIKNTCSASCYTLPVSIPAGEKYTISVKCLSGEIPDDCTVNFGGYHKGTTNSWQTTVSLPKNIDLAGKTFSATNTLTDTLTDFWIFIYAKIPTNLRVMIQYEKGSVATDYVPHDYI